MSASTIAAVGALIDAHRQLTPVLAEHLQDNDGVVLPHLLLADIIRWLVANLDSHADLAGSVLIWLEAEYQRGLDDVQGLITVSAVEMIPDPGQPGAELRVLLGPTLTSLDPWS